MKISGEVLEELRKGRSLSEIRTKFRSASEFYEGLRTFLEQLETLLEEKQTAIRLTAEQLVKTQIELENAKTEKRRLSEEVEGLTLERARK